MKISCVCFDIDGTLIDNTQDIVELFQGIIVKYLGSERKLSTQEVLAHWGPPGDEIFRKIFPPEVVETAWMEFLRLYGINHPTTGFFSKNQLLRIKEKVQYMTIFTGKSRPTCEITLEKLAIKELFDLILTGNDAPRSKPYPDALLQMIATLHLQKDETLFLGDSHLDIQAGAGAGIYTAAAVWGTMEPDKLLAQKPDFVFQTPDEFIDFVLQLNHSTET